MIAGVDEAGRGPVLGPLVVAAVLAESQEPLRRLGVKDSKQLTPARREALEPQIREAALRVEVLVVTPEELNARMPVTNLNRIEADAFGALLQRLSPREAILDACDVDADRFARHVAARAALPACVIRAMHEADATHPVVAAASIVAKVERDRHMAELNARHGGACGSGYSHDQKTRAFLERWVAERGTLPPFARHHWETSRRLVPKDRSLLEFGAGAAGADAPGAKAATKPAAEAAAKAAAEADATPRPARARRGTKP